MPFVLSSMPDFTTKTKIVNASYHLKFLLTHQHAMSAVHFFKLYLLDDPTNDAFDKKRNRIPSMKKACQH